MEVLILRRVYRMNKLTDKQQAFVDEYVFDKNATQAAIRAGYSEKTAYSQWQRLLKKAEVKKAIEEKLKKLAEKTWLNAEAVVRWLHLNATTAYEAEEYNASISARDKLGKHFGIYKEDNDQKKVIVTASSLLDKLDAEPWDD